MTAPPIARAWLRVAGVGYHYRVAGLARHEQRPLILVHGLGVSSAYWARLQPLLAATRPVYALDLPGCGHSDRLPEPLTIPEQAAALAAWLEALGLVPVDLVGHSLGGQVIAEYASRYPERVSRLVLAAPTLGTRGAGPLQSWVNILRDGWREPVSLLGVVLPAYLRAGLGRIARTEFLAEQHDIGAAVGRLTQPLLLVRGSRDCVVDRAEFVTLGRLARQARLVELAGAAHALQWSHPRATARIVEAFLAEPEREAKDIPRTSAALG